MQGLNCFDLARNVSVIFTGDKFSTVYCTSKIKGLFLICFFVLFFRARKIVSSSRMERSSTMMGWKTWMSILRMELLSKYIHNIKQTNPSLQNLLSNKTAMSISWM